MNTRKQELQEKFKTWFFGFWVKQFRISYLIVITIVVMGIISAIAIPKESSPAVKLWIISIGTSYPGTNPIDIDSLITDKIYKEVKDIKWIDKIQSNSVLGFSSVSLTLKTNAVTKDVLSDVRSAVWRIILPADAKAPTITEIETDTNRAFSIYVYSRNPDADKAIIFDRAVKLKKEIEKTPGINTVDLSAWWVWTPIETGWWNDATYDVIITIPEEKLATLGLTLASIASTVQSYNRDQPIGNFAIWEKKYDFRIEWKNRESYDFLRTPIALPKWWTITLGELAVISRKYKSDAENHLIIGIEPVLGWTLSWSVKTDTAFRYAWLTVNKTDTANIFSASDAAKKIVEEVFARSEYKDFSYVFALDLADNIRDDYGELAHEAIITLILVFIAMYLFVWFSDSVFASITLPLAFLSTFLLLFYGGYTMNFLTNFSLILSFGIAVDTIIVIVQAASTKIRVWYNPETAIMLALREYGIPIISWVMTTIVVFIPMMTLPGIMGKFLAYIPITIFWVLATWLALALTVNSALYLIFVRKSKVYVDNPHVIEYATDEEKELLLLEREWKERIGDNYIPLRIKIIHSITEWYKWILRNFLEHTFLRRLSIFVPAVLLVLSFMFLAPIIGFNLFPADDNNFTSFTITGPVGQKTEVTLSELSWATEYVKWYPEVRYATISARGNAMSISLQLSKKTERKELKQRDVFAIEKLVLGKLKTYEQYGYRVESQVVKNSPPGSKAVWLKLIVDDPIKLDTLIKVSKEFESHLKTIKWTKNVGRSSNDTPGQFIFRLKKDLIASIGITPAIIYGQISQNMNGITVGSIEDEGEDMNVVIKTSQFTDDVRLEDILAIPLYVWPVRYLVGDFIESQISNATASITREDGNIQITVDADIEEWADSVSTQSQFVEYAKSYPYPAWVSYAAGWENEANSELIVAILSAFFIALIVIFAILTIQFHSFSQPLVILYSVIMSLPFVMVGLLLTENQFSLTFGIGFIAFTGIAVNHGIILIAAINENLKKGIEGITALVEAWSSRLEPMLLTTVTTALGILPIALRDKFWSGMGFTIIFGIISASILTLFVVKGIYYEAYMRPKKNKEIKHKWNTMVNFLDINNILQKTKENALGNSNNAE
jgi:multidrug efflux pump subunit AcrB